MLFDAVCDDNGNEYPLPYKWAICSRCKGNGTHDAWRNGLTQEDLAEQDQDFIDNYVGGMFDVPCDECHGSGKVREPDTDRMTPYVLTLYNRELDAYLQALAEEAAERRAGA